jgi:DnaJ-domain-containing protein 1
MGGMFSVSHLGELIILLFLIGLLSGTDLWPRIIRGLRELRGDALPPEPARRGEDLDVSYKLLGVSPSSRWEDVERAYRQKAKIHHPDRGGDEDAMRALNEAYERIRKAKNH